MICFLAWTKGEGRSRAFGSSRAFVAVEATRPAFGDAAIYLPLRIASQVGVVSHTGPSDC